MRKIRHGSTKRHRLGMAARNGGLGLRSTTWLRANGRCWYCGVSVSRDDMTIDHIIPVARGGEYTLDNLLLACKTCNTAKASRSLEEYRESMGVGTRFWGERYGMRPAARMVTGSKRLALLGSVAVLLTGLYATATAQIVRYGPPRSPIFVSASPGATDVQVLCASVGRMAAATARARDAGVSLRAALALEPGDKSLRLANSVLAGTLYMAPTVTPEIAHLLAEGGCLAGFTGQSQYPAIAEKAVPR